jgi:hypothetical protein
MCFFAAGAHHWLFAPRGTTLWDSPLVLVTERLRKAPALFSWRVGY